MTRHHLETTRPVRGRKKDKMTKKEAYKLACTVAHRLIDGAIKTGRVYDMLESKNISYGEQEKVFDGLEVVIDYLWKESKRR